MMPDELAQPPADAPLSDELASDDVVEMANLTDAQTGVIDWVSRNRQDLLDFWYHGDTWTQPEANAFIQRLRRV